MEQPFSTSKVTVEYFDPHGVYKLLGPGLATRLPLHHLHWQSHSGPLRSIDTLHVELVSAAANNSTNTPLTDSSSGQDLASPPAIVADDGFQTATVTGRVSADSVAPSVSTTASAKPPQAAPAPTRRHQIPGLRRTPYLKLLLVRCDDNDTYKAHTRAEIKDWVKQHAAAAPSSKKNPENHDAFEWMVVHVVLPNSTAYAQPRVSLKSDGSSADLGKSRWGTKSSATIFERLRADFNTTPAITSSSTGATSKAIVDRVAQIRVDLQDVPYEMLPRAAAPAPALTPGASVEQDAEGAWSDLMDKLKTLILVSFDVRVSQYEDDIREKDVQRSLPGWNFCTFFILKEGLARGFESVGLVEDALVGYDELSVGLDMVIREQNSAQSTSHGGSLLPFTQDLKQAALAAIASADEDETVDLQATPTASSSAAAAAEIAISSTRKPYRELILANNVSVFDFRCYIFARQISLLLRLGNAVSSREELLAKLEAEAGHHVSSSRPADNADENLSMLAEICRRTAEFVPAVSQVMREDLLLALEEAPPKSRQIVIDNMVRSFAFSVAQQILAQTSTRALPIPPSTILAVSDAADDAEPKTSIPEPKTMMHPARTSSLLPSRPSEPDRLPASPGIFPSSQGVPPTTETERSKFLKVGLEDLAARRADLYLLSRNILQKAGQMHGWSDGWTTAPILADHPKMEDMEDVSLDDDNENGDSDDETEPNAGIDNILLRTALASSTGFHRLYEVLTDKCLRHYTVAGHQHSVNTSLADLAVLKFHQNEHAAAAAYFYETTPAFGESSWSLLELAMLYMYAISLQKLGRTDEYAWRMLKFLTKAAAEVGPRKDAKSYAKGCLAGVLEASTSVSTEMRVPVANFCRLMQLEGTPVYAHGEDAFHVDVRIDSLFVDGLPVDSLRVRMSETKPSHIGPAREIWLAANGLVTLSPGKNIVRLHCNTIVAGVYAIDQVRLKAKNLLLYYDAPAKESSTQLAQPTKAPAPKIFAQPLVVLYQRTDALDVKLSTCRNLQLDKNNFLELTLRTGWNDLKSCELKIRAATGGLRLTTSEARIVSPPELSFARPVGAGIVTFGALSAQSTVTMTFPFSVETDVFDLTLKIEATYTTTAGKTYVFATQPSVSTSLSLGVNVQDVFKHDALFSRFTVSTANASPLQIYRSELQDAELFTSGMGFSRAGEKAGLPLVYPKQPISLLYKILRRPWIPASKNKKKTTMYIKLHYSVFQDHLDAVIKASLQKAFSSTEALYPFFSVASAAVLRHVHAALSYGPHELERIALLSEVAIARLCSSATWEFPGLGSGTSSSIGSVISKWLASTKVLPLRTIESYDDANAAGVLRTILIPVDIPSITIVHTADIQFQDTAEVATELFTNGDDAEDEDTDDDSDDDSDSNATDASSTTSITSSFHVPIYCVNQLLPATLNLRWTRIWDSAGAEAGKYSDVEFAFEVSAPTDAWLIGGRRKGHFVIPSSTSRDLADLTSTSDTEATIPLVLIPLREGRLPYPSVEIREVPRDDQAPDIEFVGTHCETDYRNLGETVAVVADRTRVTLSLDASGPGGGPLVLESERAKMDGRELV